MAKKLLFDSNRSEIDQYFEDQASFLLKKQKLDRIDNFNGYFDFLNNEYTCPVYFDGLIFKSVAFAYQASRASLRHLREKIALADTPMELYEIANKIEDPENWASARLRMMEVIVRDKFRRNKDLKERLKATGTRELINTYSDATLSNIYWGVVEGKGQNQLGRLLEQIRNDILHNLELEKWLYMVFSLEEDRQFLPIVSLNVFKNNEVIEKIELKDKPFYQFGTLKTNDVVLAHQSISRNHAVLIVEQKMGVSLIDLQSKSGTFVDGVKLEHHIPYKLKQDAKIQFAVSSRIYTVDLDYSVVELNFEIKKKNLDKEKIIYEKLEEAGVSKEVLLASLGLVAEDTLFVANLPENVGEKEVRDLFLEFGKIKELKLPFDRKTGKSKRISFITFESEKQAKSALSADGRNLRDKRIRVTLAEKKSADHLLLEKLEGKSKEEVLRKIAKYEKMARKEIEDKFGPKKVDEKEANDKKSGNSRERSPRRRRGGSASREKSSEKPEKKENGSSEERGKRKHKKERQQKRKSRSRSRSQKKKSKID